MDCRIRHHLTAVPFPNSIVQNWLQTGRKDTTKKANGASNVGEKVEAYVLEDAEDIFGVSDRIQLAYAAKVIRKRVNRKLMASGVSIEDPDTAYISPDVTIGRDTIILPNTTIVGKCKIGEANWIGPNSTLIDVNMGNDNKVHYSILQGINLKDGENVGPFANINKQK